MPNKQTSEIEAAEVAERAAINLIVQGHTKLAARFILTAAELRKEQPNDK